MTNAQQKFDENCADVRRLLEIHGDIAGEGPGRKYGLEVLNKSAVVLITAFWEAFCEDIAAEGLEFLVDRCPDALSLPKELRKRVAAEVTSDRDELAMWRLAGDGWRVLLSDRLHRLQEERNRKLNTPKAKQIDELFSTTLGIPAISKWWRWQRMTSDQACEKLDRYIALRGSIAHRGAGAATVRKTEVTDYFGHVSVLVDRTSHAVGRHTKEATGLDMD